MQRNSLYELWRSEERAPFAGWDFAHLDGRMIRSEPPWSYESIVRDAARDAKSALDLGTGGGERLSALRRALPRHLVATENHPPNLKLAQERLGRLDVEVVEAEDSLHATLPFADAMFDLVIDRHSAFNAREVARVLRPGGAFVTQQVNGRSFADLTAALGGEPMWPFFTLEFARREVETAGLTVHDAREWCGPCRFTDVGAIVYYVKAVPWMAPADFSVERYLPRLQSLQQRLDNERRPIEFQERLFLLRATLSRHQGSSSV